MPKVTVAVPHDMTPEEIKEKADPVITKTVKDFEGRDLEVTWDGFDAKFKFKSMAFTINGTTKVGTDQIVIEVDLPFAAMMFKDKAEKAIRKNLTRAIEQDT